MSTSPPDSLTYLRHTIRSGLREGDSFEKFFERWIAEQNQHLEELVSASKEEEAAPDRGVLRPLVKRVVQHYEHYYRAKGRWGKTDILAMLSPSWRSSLEDAFLWVGGWRPSMAFHLLYSKSGLQLEARLQELMQGLSTGDLGDLSATQLEQVDVLQKETIRKEQEITEKLAEQQETVADASMVELAHAMTEAEAMDVDVGQSRVDATLAPKQDALVGLLHMADQLRLNTLRKVIDILTPMQAVHYLIAAAALHLRIHEWGKKRDARLSQNVNTQAR
ncbi:protein DOG1-like 3 [Salvia miltiorrhiza]|uniref:protein DOG1-like 3 n=1 Tax=Salvia miltiorrhiza TaxID=226208 RepID=UPI0025AC25B8|nr:protein DOG1-like 3 [Salvia miltiorrhiza]